MNAETLSSSWREVTTLILKKYTRNSTK